MPNSGYFDVVFAVSGDVTAVPDAVQPDGSISYQQGWGPYYAQDPAIDPSTALFIDRAQTNQLFKDLTSAVQQYQQFGIPPFITTSMNNGTPFSYAQYAVVVSGGVAYQSITGSNTDTPPSSKWAAFPLGFSPFTTGDIKPTIKTTADAGWVLLADGTIGDASSSATERANADTVNLFTLLWNNFSNGVAPVSGGRGGSAAADFAAHKTIQVGTFLSRAMGVAGHGSGLTSRALGEIVGDENLQSHTHTLTDPGHNHNSSAGTSTGTPHNSFNTTNNGGGFVDSGTIASNTTGITMATAGTGTAGNMQPTTFVNWMIKL